MLRRRFVAFTKEVAILRDFVQRPGGKRVARSRPGYAEGWIAKVTGDQLCRASVLVQGLKCLVTPSCCCETSAVGFWTSIGLSPLFPLLFVPLLSTIDFLQANMQTELSGSSVNQVLRHRLQRSISPYTDHGRRPPSAVQLFIHPHEIHGQLLLFLFVVDAFFFSFALLECPLLLRSCYLTSPYRFRRPSSLAWLGLVHIYCSRGVPSPLGNIGSENLNWKREKSGYIAPSAKTCRNYYLLSISKYTLLLEPCLELPAIGVLFARLHGSTASCQHFKTTWHTLVRCAF